MSRELSALRELFQEYATIPEFEALSPSKIEILLAPRGIQNMQFFIQHKQMTFQQLITLPNNRLKVLLDGIYKHEYLSVLAQLGITMQMFIMQSSMERFQFWVHHFELVYLYLQKQPEKIQAAIGAIFLKFNVPALQKIIQQPPTEELETILAAEFAQVEKFEQRGFDRPNVLQTARQIGKNRGITEILPFIVQQRTHNILVPDVWCVIVSFVVDTPDTGYYEILRDTAKIFSWQPAQLCAFFRKLGGDEGTAHRLFVEKAPYQPEVIKRLLAEKEPSEAVTKTLDASEYSA